MRLPHALRTGLKAFAVIVMAGLAYVAVTFVRVRTMADDVSSASVDAIVVMGAAQYDGAPSEMLERRLQAALALWNGERAKWIAVTGGKREGDRFTEAAASAAWLAKRGVPESAILSEDAGRSTWESLSGLKNVLVRNKVESTLVVTTDWHVARAVYSMRDLGFGAEPASAGPAQGSASRWLRETVAVAVGWIIGFDRLHGITG